MKIKVCGITKIDQLESIADLDIDLAGLIFYKGSPRFHNLDPKKVKAVNIKRVGVFVNETEREVINHAKKYDLTFLQLHGDESPAMCESLKNSGYRVVKAFGIDSAFDFSMLKRYAGQVDYFLFDTNGKKRGGTGRLFNWSLLESYYGEIPYFLSGGISLEQIDDLVNMTDYRCHYVDINSQFESSPGIKIIEKIKEFKHGLSN